MPTDTFGYSEKKPARWNTASQWAQYMHDGDWLNLSSTFPGPGMLSRVPYEVPGIWLRSCRFEDR